MALTGCTGEARHQVLSFFFTGVPPLAEETADVKISMEPTPPAGVERRVEATEEILYSHPVWDADVCDPCHATSGGFSIPGINRKSVKVFQTGGGMVGPLTLPKDKLCIQCHKDKTPQRAMAENLWLHNTTAKGDCLACHDPHQSKNPRTLRQPPAGICSTSCHVTGTFMVTPVHQTAHECLFCHNPHLGSNKDLLKKDYQENKIPVTEISGHPELGR